jgi:hypothetical protein
MSEKTWVDRFVDMMKRGTQELYDEIPPSRKRPFYILITCVWVIVGYFYISYWLS